MKSYHIRFSDQAPDTVLLPYVFPEVHSLQAISFGTGIVPCKMETDYVSDTHITIGTHIAEQLRLPFAAEIHAFVHEDTVMLGPLIGIFTAGFTESMLRPIGERSLFFANLLTATAANKAYMFVFGSHAINWQEGTVTGYFYNKERWVQHEVPLPHVVYDRLPNRKTENHRAIVRVKQRLQQEYLIPWFNPGFFNKWDIYQMLQDEPAALPYLPRTEQFTSFEQIELMLAQYGHVYVKPMNGSLGNSIYQIRYAFEENVYYCRYRSDEKNRLRKYHSLEYLVNHLLRNHDLEHFIVQQGIPLFRLNGQPVDFRVHTNKNRSGTWQLTAIAAKVAGQGSMTTHVSNGGEVLTLEELFPDALQRDRVQQKLTEAVLTLSRCIDEHVDGCIGEIGFDIGLDKQERVWLFEANSKPGRTIFEHPKLKESDRLTKELFLEYALHLTEKSIFSPEELFR